MNKVKEIEEKNIKHYMEYAPKWIREYHGFTTWLQEKGFFVTAASVKYHSNYVGGLYEHSRNVCEILKEYRDMGLVQWDRKESPFIIGMFHDLCKVDDYKLEYERYIEADDGEEFGKGEVTIVKNNEVSMLPGHGEKSLIYLLQWIELTSQEIACIRWHMGAFDDSKMWAHYGKAVEQEPNVLYTHTADMYASHCLGK